MRVIVPPTGNETIAMVKDTSLLAAVPSPPSCSSSSRRSAPAPSRSFPAFVAATLWYLDLCSILMVGQYFLERRFGRGLRQRRRGRQPRPG